MVKFRVLAIIGVLLIVCRGQIAPEKSLFTY